MAFLSLWIVVPAPTMMLLRLGVGVPELSPVLLVVALTVGALAWRHGQVAAGAVCLVASLLLAWPIMQFPREAPLSLSQLALGVKASAARTTRGVVFASPGGVTLTADIYQPEQPGRFPTVVQIYGGAWQRGAPGDDSVLAEAVAARGFVVFAIDYRHAPRWQWPAQRDDVQAALAWIRAHGESYGADTTRIALVGRSSGAQLAMVTALTDTGISGAIGMYGPVDLARGWREPPVPDPIGSRAVLEAFLGGPPDRHADAYRDASPITYVSSRAPRSLLLYGARDHIVRARFGVALHDALVAAGAKSELVVIPWAEHAFDALPGGLSGQLTLFHTVRFLSEVLK
jgi:acetyl esterase/lipase